jgi:hypothetical protein
LPSVIGSVLTSDALAIEPFHHRTRAVSVPSGSIVQVVKYPCQNDRRMTDVLLDGRPITIFALDLVYRSDEVKVKFAGG